jgi:hypothetical protein
MNAPENKAPAIPAKSESAVKFQDVKFIHNRSPDFRTYHADGSWAVLNGQNAIHLNFFSEYPQIAAGVVNQVNPLDGKYTGEFELQGLEKNCNAVIREFQCSVVLSVESAGRLYSLLKTFIDLADKNAADQKARAEQNK